MSSISDAILEDILRQAALTNVNLVNLLKAQGGTATASSGNTVAATNKAMSVAGGLVAAAFTAIGAVTGVLSTAFSYLSNAVMETGKRIYAFAKEAALGTAAMSAFYRAFDQLPIIGKVFSMFGDYLDYTESLLKSYQDISKSGASFSGSLQEMRQTATAAWMNLEEFGRVIKENGSIFATSIGGTSAGLSKFVAAQSTMMKTYGASILGLGVTAEEAGNMLGLYMKMQGNMTKLQGQSTDQIAASTFGLITQLDAYAKITGQSREQAEEELKKQTLEENLKRFMQGLDPDQMAAAQFSLTEAMRLGGQGLRDKTAQLIMSQGQITAPLTKASQDLSIQTQGASDVAAGILYNNAINNKLGTDAFTAATLQARNTMVTGSKGLQDSVGSIQLAMMSLTGQITLSSEASRTMNEGYKDITATIADVTSAQKKQGSGTAAATALQQAQMKMAGMNFGAAILSLLERFGPTLTMIGDRILALFNNTFTKIINSGVIEKFVSVFEKYLLPAIEKGINWLSDTFAYLADSETMADLWVRVGKKAVEGVTGLWATVKPAFIEMWKAIEPIIVEGLTNLFTAIITAIPSAIASAAFNGVMGLGALAAKPGNWIGEKLYPSTKSAPPPQTTPIAREFGGRVQSGKEYLVGERGREKFVAPSDGTIIPESSSNDRENNLLREIRMLNRHVEQLIIHNRDTAIYTRRNADAISSLSGDLFKF
jgi:hypothetical protein